MITVLAFVLTLGVLIVIHEYGHYRVAKACGVKVLRFSVGFGRVLWRRQANPDATEFVISALPLGGYVRMLDEREGPVPRSELHMAFNRKPLWQRAAVVAAGPVANLALAVVLFTVAHWIGVEQLKATVGTPVPASVAERSGLRSGDTVLAVSHDGSTWRDVRSMNELHAQLMDAVLDGERLHLRVQDGPGGRERSLVLDLDTLSARDVDAQMMRTIGFGPPYSEPVVGEVIAGGPAAQAGLRAGDLVLSVDGRPMDDSGQLRETIRGSMRDGQPVPMQWRVQRAGQTLDITVQPVLEKKGDVSVARIRSDIGKSPEMVTVEYGGWEGAAYAVEETWRMSGLTLRMLGLMVVNQVSLKNISGPLTIADVAGQTVRMGLAYYLSFLAVVSIGLGVLNLLPLPMLDGGHLMYYLFEAVTGRPVSDVWLERLQRGGFAIIIMMTSLALYNDVARLLGQH